MDDVQIGTVTHYYDKIGVAVMELSKPLSVGDRIKISGHDREFEQTVMSLQVEHSDTQTASPGQSCGLKVDEPVRAGDVVYAL